MERPFGSWYGLPSQQRRPYSYNPSLFGVPVQPVDPSRQSLHSAYDYRQPPVEKESEGKVVRIPVQFVGSGSDRRPESALRIQKVFRGFFVRKSIKKIKEIESQVDEIEARLLRPEVVAMIRGNERERLKMSESLMNLLLKLDGIRGIDWGIRACRKSVAKKAIALQEKIDAIFAADSAGNGDHKVEIGSREPEDVAEQVQNDVAAEIIKDSGFENSNHFEEMQEEWEKMEVEEDSEHSEGFSEVNPYEETCPVKGTMKNLDSDDGEELKSVDFPAAAGKGISQGETEHPQDTEGTLKNLDSDDGEELKGVDVHPAAGKAMEPPEDTEAMEEVSDMAVVEEEELKKGKDELLEKMMEENKRMMAMMTQLHESNEKQLQMLDGLTSRVELMEKAYLCDKLRNRRKKMKKKKNCTLTCTED